MRIRRIGEAGVYENIIRAKPELYGIGLVDVGLHYPQVAVNRNPTAGVHITGCYMARTWRYYRHACTELYRSAAAQLAEDRRHGYPFRPYAAAMGYTVPYNHNGFLSIWTDTYEYTGGAHGNTVRCADTWNLATARRMPLEAFFTSPCYRGIILSGVAEQIRAQTAKGGTGYLEDWPAAIGRCFDERNFFLTPEGIGVFYPLYTIAPYAAGLPVFIIPYPNFGGMLRFEL